MFLRLNKLPFSHNHHHHSRFMSESEVASLHAFRSLVSDNLNRVLVGSESLSLKWIHRCFEMLPMINTAFAKLMVEIDYPISRWEAGSIDEYLDYTINMLEILNSISSSLCHVNQACVSLTHALSLMESSPNLAIERMREITSRTDLFLLKNKGFPYIRPNITLVHAETNQKENGKEWILREAMMVLKSIGFRVCGIVLSGLRSDVKPITEITRDGLFMDSIFKKFTEEGRMVKEVERVNESVSLIVSSKIGDSDVGIELKTRLEVLRNGLKGLKEEEEALFGRLMAARNKVLETLRTRNNH